MTKLELMKMLENVNDNEEITFVISTTDRDGFPYDTTANVYKVLGGETIMVRRDYGIITIEKKTDEFEYVPRKNMYGFEIGYWRKRG